MSVKQKDFLDYLLPLFSNVREFRALADVIDNTIRRAYDDIAAMCDAPFIKHASERWLARHEAVLGVTPKPSDTDAVRHLRLAAKGRFGAPYTESMLRHRLAELCGEENFTLDVNAAASSLSVAISAGSDEEFEIIKDMIVRMVPANLVVSVSREE
jgi:hypothetical protein